MILDLNRFVETGRPQWTALEKTLTWMEANPTRKLTIEEIERLHVLYQRVAADLAKTNGLAGENELREYLGWLVGRAYAEIHETRDRRKFRPWRWFTAEFPKPSEGIRVHFNFRQL